MNERLRISASAGGSLFAMWDTGGEWVFHLLGAREHGHRGSARWTLRSARPRARWTHGVHGLG
jgi:hypothetical protein